MKKNNEDIRHLEFPAHTFILKDSSEYVTITWPPAGQIPLDINNQPPATYTTKRFNQDLRVMHHFYFNFNWLK